MCPREVFHHLEELPKWVFIVVSHINESVQERRNSSALAMEYVFLALTHRYGNNTPDPTTYFVL